MKKDNPIPSYNEKKVFESLLICGEWRHDAQFWEKKIFILFLFDLFEIRDDNKKIFFDLFIYRFLRVG